ncbi:MAG: hypothetical protein CMD33_03025 [Flavobacteriales bacterium]|nr:hypothetical protein [Flavobacteriales bacterium]
MIVLICCAGLTFTGCEEKPNFQVPKAAFDADVPTPVDIRGLMRRGEFDSWHTATGSFGYSYTEDILRIGSGADPATVAGFKTFLEHPNIAPIEAAIDTTSGSAAHLLQNEEVLTRAFQRFHHWFPDAPLPRIMWMNSGFNYAVYPTDQHLGIGLEWFLGKDHPIVSTLPPEMFPQYMRNRMEPDRISASAFRGWLLVHFSNPWYRTDRCVDEMLFWGKVIYIMEQCMPDLSKADLWDWTAEAWTWAQVHERDIWLELQPQDALFNTDRTQFSKWFNEGPFTRYGAIPQDSPDRLGAYMGWRMVSDFMEKHPEVDLAALMEVTDINPVVKAYRPL